MFHMYHFLHTNKENCDCDRVMRIMLKLNNGLLCVSKTQSRQTIFPDSTSGHETEWRSVTVNSVQSHLIQLDCVSPVAKQEV